MTATAGRLFDRVVTFCAVLAGLLLVGQMLAVCADVASRFAFNFPLRSVNALTEWSLVYIAFLGAAWLQREKGHVSVDMLILALPRGAARALVILGLVLGLVVTAVIAVFAVRVTAIKFLENEYDFFKLAWMPIWVIYAVIPFGAALWFVQLCRDAVGMLTGRGAVPVERRLGD